MGPSVQKVERLSYFSMHPADYLLDTVDLSLSEHGIYLLMMLRYYWEGRLLVAEKYRGCRTDADRAAADAIAARFFHVDGELLVHNRIERELEKIRAFVEHQSNAGKASGAARKAKNKKREPTQHRVNGSQSSFDSFYAAYPRHVDRAKAEKAWLKIAPDDALRERIMRAVDAQKKSAQWTKDNGAFIPHPASWLNGKRWEDEVTIAPIPEKRVAI